MPRGRFWYGPGFWKRGTNWVPGSGGFRGGANPQCFPPAAGRPPAWGGWGPCHYWGPAWGETPLAPQDEAQILREEAEQLRAELSDIESRLEELEKESKEE